MEIELYAVQQLNLESVFVVYEHGTIMFVLYFPDMNEEDIFDSFLGIGNVIA